MQSPTPPYHTEKPVALSPAVMNEVVFMLGRLLVTSLDHVYFDDAQMGYTQRHWANYRDRIVAIFEHLGIDIETEIIRHANDMSGLLTVLDALEMNVKDSNYAPSPLTFVEEGKIVLEGEPKQNDVNPLTPAVHEYPPVTQPFPFEKE